MGTETKAKQGADNLLRSHRIMTLVEARAYLEGEVRNRLVGARAELCWQVLRDERFWQSPAARNRHQAYPGGLAIHTAQVLCGALAMLEPVREARTMDVVVACVWHDAGKVFDYEEVTDNNKHEDEIVGTYRGTDHREMIGHLPRSYAMFFAAVEKLFKENGGLNSYLDPSHHGDTPSRGDLEREQADFISHLILSHHGRRDWGSPVEPLCAEAWAIHAADMMSSQFITDAS